MSGAGSVCPLPPFLRDNCSQMIYHCRQGRYVTEYTHNFVMNPEYVGPAEEAKKADERWDRVSCSQSRLSVVGECSATTHTLFVT